MPGQNNDLSMKASIDTTAATAALQSLQAQVEKLRESLNMTASLGGMGGSGGAGGGATPSSSAAGVAASSARESSGRTGSAGTGGRPSGSSPRHGAVGSAAVSGASVRSPRAGGPRPPSSGGAGGPTGPSGIPAGNVSPQPEEAGLTSAQVNAQRSIMKGFGRGAMLAIGRTAYDMIHGYEQVTLTGQAQPMAFGGAMGAGIGGLIGAGIGATFGGFGGVIGAGVGSQVGQTAVNALQSPWVAQRAMQQQNFQSAFMQNAIQSQTISAGMAQDSKDSASAMNDNFVRQNLRDSGYFKTLPSYAMRWLGMYTGQDQTSPQIINSIKENMSAVGLSRGEIWDRDKLKDMANKVGNAYKGEEGKDMAKLMAQGAAAYASSGGNPLDMIGKAGVVATNAFWQNTTGGSVSASALVAFNIEDQAQKREGRMAGLASDIAGSQFARGSLSGRRLQDREGDMQTRARYLRGHSDTLTNRARYIASQEHGLESEQYAEARSAADQALLSEREFDVEVGSGLLSERHAEGALGIGQFQQDIKRRQLYGGSGNLRGQSARGVALLNRQAEIDQAYADDTSNPYDKRLAAAAGAQGYRSKALELPASLVSADLAEGGMKYGSVTAGLQSAAVQSRLYGGPSDFAVTAARQKQTLVDRNAYLSGMNNTPGISQQDWYKNDQEQKQNDARLKGIPAALAAENVGYVQDVGATRQSATDLARMKAGSFGDDASLLRASRESITNRQRTIGDLNYQLHDPALSDPDRRKVQRDIDSMEGANVQEGIASNSAVIARESARESINKTIAGIGWNRARRLGRAGDVVNAGYRRDKELGDEDSLLESQYNRENTTEEQKIGIRHRREAIKGERFDIAQDSIDGAYGKADTEFDTQHMRMAGQLRRMSSMPFSPGNHMAASLALAVKDGQQLSQLSQREAWLRSTGNLSPEREHEIEGQRQGLLDERASTIGQLAEGGPNRLAMISAGGMARRGRWDSMSLARLFVAPSGSPRIGYGAAGGAALASQNAWFHQFDQPGQSGMGLAGPGRSLNSNFAGEGAGMGQIVALLTQLVKNTMGSSNPAGGGRPSQLGAILGDVMRTTTVSRAAGGLTGGK